MLGMVALLLVPAYATIVETWESSAIQDPFAGQADLTWTGDLGGFRITDAAWPADYDFAGARSIRSKTSDTAVHDTIVTRIGDRFSLSVPMSWSVFVSGTTGTDGWITSNRDFAFVLMSTTNDPASIEAGSMSGYRVQLQTIPSSSDDRLVFQVATGSGWNTIGSNNVGAAQVGFGWNLAAQRLPDGTWNWGYANGAIGTPVLLTNSVSDTAVLSATYAGMTWRSPSTGAQYFGFDNFSFTGVPEPSTLVLLVVGLALIRARRAALRRR